MILTRYSSALLTTGIASRVMHKSATQRRLSGVVERAGIRQDARTQSRLLFVLIVRLVRQGIYIL